MQRTTIAGISLFLALSVTAEGGGGGGPGIGSRRFPGGTISLPPALACPDMLRDDAVPANSFAASQTPAMGQLLPLGAHLFVDPTGNVGLGTTIPVSRLHVASGDMNIRDGALQVRGTDTSAPLEIGTSTAEPRPHVTDGFASILGGPAPEATFATGGYALRTADPSLGAVLETGVGGSGGAGVLHSRGADGAGFELRTSGVGHTFDADAGSGFGRWVVDTPGPSGSFEFEGGATDGDGRLLLRDKDGDVAIELDATEDLLGDGGAFSLFSDTMDEVVQAFSFLGGAGFGLGDSVPSRLVATGGTNLGSGAVLAMNNASGQEVVRLDAKGSSGGSELILVDVIGNQSFFARTVNSSSSIPVMLRMFNPLLAPAALTSVELTAPQAGKSAVLHLASQSGRTVTLNGQSATGSTGGGIEVATLGVPRFEVYDNCMTLFDTAGNPTIQYDGVAGTKSAVLETSSGRRRVYCSESAEVWFEDAGVARLRDGRAEIELDPVFLQTVVVDAEHPWNVSASARSMSPGVWVEKHSDRLVIHELPGGTGDGLVDWRVQAHRKGLEDTRMQLVSK